MVGWVTKPSKFQKKVEKEHVKLMAEKAIRIHGKLIQRTPQDTGHAAANWLPGRLLPDLTEKKTTGSKGEKIQSSSEAVKRKFDPNKIKPFSSLYISNIVKYITVLNYGRPLGTPWSMKKPLHFFETTIQEEGDEL